MNTPKSSEQIARDAGFTDDGGRIFRTVGDAVQEAKDWAEAAGMAAKDRKLAENGGRYVIGGWSHIFGVGSANERGCRIVFDRQENKLAHIEIERGVRGWVPATDAERLDVEDSLKNANDEAITSPEDWGLEASDRLPDWTSPTRKLVDLQFSTMTDAELAAACLYTTENDGSMLRELCAEKGWQTASELPEDLVNHVGEFLKRKVVQRYVIESSDQCISPFNGEEVHLVRWITESEDNIDVADLPRVEVSSVTSPTTSWCLAPEDLSPHPEAPVLPDRKVVQNHDFASHRDAWRGALVIAHGLARAVPPDVDDKAYWSHEINVYDKAFDRYVSGSIPDDFLTHRSAWREALVIARDHAEVSLPDIDDKAYWEREIRAYDRAFDGLESSSKDRNMTASGIAVYVLPAQEDIANFQSGKRPSNLLVRQFANEAELDAYLDGRRRVRSGHDEINGLNVAGCVVSFAYREWSHIHAPADVEWDECQLPFATEGEAQACRQGISDAEGKHSLLVVLPEDDGYAVLAAYEAGKLVDANFDPKLPEEVWLSGQRIIRANGHLGVIYNNLIGVNIADANEYATYLNFMAEDCGFQLPRPGDRFEFRSHGQTITACGFGDTSPERVTEQLQRDVLNLSGKNEDSPSL